MGSPGRGFFAGGSVAFIMVGLMHLTAHIHGRPPSADAAHEAMLGGRAQAAT